MSEALPSAAAARVWVLLGDKGGDNAQALALAAALGLPFAEKRMHYNPLRLLWNGWLGASLMSVDRAASASLAPPWPDLVIAVGRRSVPVARWIRARSGGQARLVQIGRPRAPARLFDLVLTTPQYRFARAGNVIELPLPFGRDPAAPEPAGDSPVPRPAIAVLVGGPSGLYRLDARAAPDLKDRVTALARAIGGGVLLITSRRTPAAVADLLCRDWAVPAVTHRFGAAGDNPYRRFLALADAVVVTADSASMIADGLGTGRPVLVWEAPPLPAPAIWWWRFDMAFGQGGPGAGGPIGRLWAWLNDRGIVSAPRRLDRLVDALVAGGMVTRLGTGQSALPPPGRALDQLARGRAAVLDRIRTLLQGKG